MLGKNFKLLISQYYNELSYSYESIYELMDLDEEILLELILPDEDNFVSAEKRTVLFETAFIEAPVNSIVFTLRKMKSVDYA